jgi:DNA-damage-inducible protein J
VSKTTALIAHIDPELKTQAEALLLEAGFTAEQAITWFYQQVVRQHQFPFEFKPPNQVTLTTFQETDAGNNVVRCQSAEDMFKQLGL